MTVGFTVRTIQTPGYRSDKLTVNPLSTASELRLVIVVTVVTVVTVGSNQCYGADT